MSDFESEQAEFRKQAARFSGAAFPQRLSFQFKSKESTTFESFMMGLSKREYFAAMALQGIVSSINIGRGEWVEGMCETAVKYADALINELAKDNQT